MCWLFLLTILLALWHDAVYKCLKGYSGKYRRHPWKAVEKSGLGEIKEVMSSAPKYNLYVLLRWIQINNKRISSKQKTFTIDFTVFVYIHSVVLFSIRHFLSCFCSSPGTVLWAVWQSPHPNKVTWGKTSLLLHSGIFSSWFLLVFQQCSRQGQSGKERRE